MKSFFRKIRSIFVKEKSSSVSRQCDRTKDLIDIDLSKLHFGSVRVSIVTRKNNIIDRINMGPIRDLKISYKNGTYLIKFKILEHSEQNYFAIDHISTLELTNINNLTKIKDDQTISDIDSQATWIFSEIEKCNVVKLNIYPTDKHELITADIFISAKNLKFSASLYEITQIKK